MSKSQPAAPPQANPVAVAGAQTGSNITTGAADAASRNADQYGPYGQTTFDVNGSQSIYDPTTKQTYDVPTYSQTTTLSPAEQQKLDQGYALNSKLTDLAISQADRIGGVLGQPIQAPQGSIQRSVDMAQAPTTAGQTAGSVQYGLRNPMGDIQYNVDPNSHAQDRNAVEAALFSRLNPQLQQERDQLETRLANQGFTRDQANPDGAFGQAQQDYTRNANDARLAVTAQGLAEQQGLFGMDLASGQFNNAAQAQDYGQALQSGEFANSAQSQDFDQLMARLQAAQQGTQINNTSALNAGQFANQSYGQQLQTDLALRNQPINEISALMSGNQVNLPQFTPYQGGGVANVPIGDYYMQNAQMANANYQAQLQANAQQTAGLYSGLGSVAGAGLYGLGRKYGV